MQSSDQSDPPRSRSLTRNAAYNLAGAVVPLFISLATIPLYLRHLGEVRYGIVALVWLLFGYFGLFDLGLSKAASNRLVQPDQQEPKTQATLFWTALVANFVLGSVGGLLFWAVAEPLLSQVTGLSGELVGELRAAIPWTALLLPLTTASAVLVGALEARERFFELNAIQLVGSVLVQLIPLGAIFLLGPSIAVVVAATALARLFAALPLAVLAVRQAGGTTRIRVRLEVFRSLFRYGAWVTTTSVVGPILVSIDQLLIGAALGARAVTLYVVPFNLATKALLVPAALTRALFPRLSAASGGEARARASAVASTVALALAMICAPSIFLADVGLQVWLGRDFADQASTVARIVLFGTWVNGVAHVPFALLQSQGRPDLPAKFHLLELLPFVGLLWSCLHFFGLVGAALAWVVRVSFDTGLLFWAAGLSGDATRRSALPFAATTIALAACLLFEPGPRVALLCAATLILVLAFHAYRSDAILRRLLTRAVAARASI